MRYCVVERETPLGAMYYVTFSGCPLEAGEDTVFTCSDLDKVDLRKMELQHLASGQEESPSDSPASPVQQLHGAEPSEICPECQGSGRRIILAPYSSRPCGNCDGTGKLHHA